MHLIWKRLQTNFLKITKTLSKSIKEIDKMIKNDNKIKNDFKEKILTDNFSKNY